MVRKFICSMLAAAGATLLHGGPSAAVGAAVTIPAADTVSPGDRLNEDWWRERHERLLAMIATHHDPEVVLIGDSITNNYDKAAPPDENFRPTWDAFYELRHALNLGFSGDTTDNVLWRLQHGEVAKIRPKVAILLIGTKDTGLAGRSAARTAQGIDAVVTDLERRLPDTRILLLGLLPSAVSPAKSATDAAVNQRLAVRYGEDPRVTYLDIGAAFRRANGTLDEGVFYDPRLAPVRAALHPDTVGQRRMAEAIEPTLAHLLGEPPRVPLASMTAVNTAVIPVSRLEQDSYDWFTRHHAALDTLRSVRPDVVMIGDSITHFWGGRPDAAQVRGPQSWRALFGDRPVLNLGFGWDRTQNVLWRLRQGELTGAVPRWVVINIGTNNLTATSNARANRPDEIVAGIVAVVNDVHARAPAARVVVMGVFPRGREANDPQRAAIIAINRQLAQRFAGDATVRFLDIGGAFLDRQGRIPPSLMPDALHPSEAGYALWGQALQRIGVGR